MIRLARASRLATATRGASSVEFALVAAFLMIPLVLGVYDFGTALWSWMQVGNAARAGAQYINVNGYSSTYKTSGNSCPSTPTNTFTCAVQGATSLGTNVSVAAGTAYCGCQNGTAYTSQAYAPPCNVCGSFVTANCCPAGQTPVTMTQVTATYNYKPIFNYLGFGPTSGFDLSAQATALIY
jgi:Flp pilus assembly protein TadG